MFKNLQGLSLLHQLWNGTFSAWMFLKSGNQVGIAFWHCTTAKTTQVHIFMTAIWDKLEKSSPLLHCLFYIFHITFFSSVKLPLLYSVTKLYQSKLWQQPKDTHQVEIPFVKEIVYFLTFMRSDHVPCKVTLLLASFWWSICIIFSH